MRSIVALALLFLTMPARSVEKPDPCSAASTISDVQFTLEIKDHPTAFQPGEIIPLALSFSSTTKNRYWADVRNYDRSGRLGIESYCVEPQAPDPLASYFKTGGFLGGGLGTRALLNETPLRAEAELNEWRTLPPGHHRLYAISCRVSRPAEARDNVPYSRVSEVVRSNVIEIDVTQPDPQWQGAQLRSAVFTLTGSGPSDEALHAARILRFLNTQDSTRQLAKLFWGLNQQQPVGFDLMLGLYGSPYRQLAIDSMRAEVPQPERAITSEFIDTLVNLQVSIDPRWDSPTAPAERPQDAQTFLQRRREHIQELRKAEIQAAAAALTRKSPSVRALTLNGMVMAGGDDSAVRLELVAAWSDLPRETREDLVQNRWPSIAGPEMLPILRRMIAEPPPPARTAQAMTRDAVLQHLYELDPTEGRDAIRKDLLNDKAQPGLALIQLLPKEDIAAALRPAVERIGKRAARELDFDLVDRYADATVLEPMQSAFEAQAGQWGCASQSAMLRYFLRVAPEYGVTEVSAALGARKNTGCFRLLLSDLEAELPKAQPVAIGALDDADPEVAQSAAGALGLWGSADAEKQLWVRLEWFHKEWEGREEQLRATADRESAGSRAAVMEAVLVSAIARGTNWLCPPESLAKLSDLVWNKDQRQQIEAWRKQWNEGPAVIQTNWFPQDKPTFSILQYVGLTEEQLGAKLAQFRSGTELGWQFWQPGQISPLVSMVKQEAVYERMRAVAGQRGIILQKVNHP